MNTLLLQPTDVLFFRDGRPMGGSLGGHGAAWPLPTVANAALHAALHRAALEGVHPHRRGRSGDYSQDPKHRDRKFGSLVTAGPFPVIKPEAGPETWLFPRPLDTGVTKETELDSTSVTFQPLAKDFTRENSSLPKPLKWPVAANRTPTKTSASPWWTQTAWDAYLRDTELMAEKQDATSNERGKQEPKKLVHFHKDNAFADTEFSYGIGIDAESGTQDGERFYSAHYLRLKPGCRLGLLAEAWDKVDGDPNNKRDLIPRLFTNSGTYTPVIVGGQQRLCTVEAHHQAAIPLPKGKTTGFSQSQASDGKDIWLVKWVLLTPAIFPAINDHTGGWLPSWVDLKGHVQLLDGPGKNYAERHKVRQGEPIHAQLVAALTGKPIPVTGYALPHEAADREHGSAKPTHLAVPAGSVYYFQADTKEAAEKLAAALNWHSADDLTAIRNRRSTLMGEKGFGLGVCGTWEFHDGTLPHS